MASSTYQRPPPLQELWGPWSSLMNSESQLGSTLRADHREHWRTPRSLGDRLRPHPDSHPLGCALRRTIASRPHDKEVNEGTMLSQVVVIARRWRQERGSRRPALQTTGFGVPLWGLRVLRFSGEGVAHRPAVGSQLGSLACSNEFPHPLHCGVSDARDLHRTHPAPVW